MNFTLFNVEPVKERNFLAQCTDEDTLRDLLEKERVPFYIGFDPTADSLHAGPLIALMAMWLFIGNYICHAIV